MWLLNPALLFSATWLLVLSLFSLKLSDLLDPLRPGTVVLVAGSSVLFVLGWLVESFPRKPVRISPRVRLRQLAKAICGRRAGKRLRLATALFIVGITVEVLIGGGAPMLGILGVGNEIRYTDFGVPGLHGFLNSLFYATSSIAFARFLFAPRAVQPSAWRILIPFLYPLLGMSRQVAISLVVQYFFIYLAIRQPSIKLYLRVLFMFAGVFLVFGYLGDLRSGRESIVQLAAPTFDYPEWLPSAFLWFYIYVCTPLNNLNFNIDLIPHYFPLETFSSFIPSVFRDSFLGLFGGAGNWALSNESFNVSSFFQALLSDFGIAGTLLLSLCIGMLLSRLSRNSTSSPTRFFALVIFLHGLALSFFANLLFHLVFLAQIFLTAILLRRARQ